MNKKTWIIIGCVVVGLGLIGSLAGGLGEKNKEIAVSGDLSYYAAMDDATRKEQCENKYVEVSGTVTYAGSNLIYIGNSFSDGISIHCQFSEAGDTEGVECGDTIKVQGKCTSVYSSIMNIDECVLIGKTSEPQGTEQSTTKVTSESTYNTTTTNSSPKTTQTTTEEMVWIPTNGGQKYHRNSSCSQMQNPKQVTKEEAIRRGFTPCGRCW